MGFGPASPTPPGTLDSAIGSLRQALGNFRTLLTVGLVATVLTLVDEAVDRTSLTTLSLLTDWPTGTLTYATVVSWIVGASVVVLVLIGLVVGISGFVQWRRSLREFRRAAPQLTGPPAGALAESLRDERRTVVTFLLLILVAIVVGILLGITSAALLAVGHDALPGSVTGTVEGLAVGGFGVMMYAYGTRHLLGAFAAARDGMVPPPATAAREIVLLGAVLGWAGSASALFWPLQVLSVVGLAVILAGIAGIARAFDASPTAPPPAGAMGSAPRPA